MKIKKTEKKHKPLHNLSKSLKWTFSHNKEQQQISSLYCKIDLGSETNLEKHRKQTIYKHWSHYLYMTKIVDQLKECMKSEVNC